MKVKVLTVFALMMACSFFACKPDPSHQIVQGKWKAMAMDTNGEIKDLSNGDVWFQFTPNGTYEYSTNNSYKEAGQYRMRAKVLYTTDTINASSIEKAVRLAVVHDDSIHFEMNSKGIAQTLRLKRVR